MSSELIVRWVLLALTRTLIDPVRWKDRQHTWCRSYWDLAQPEVEWISADQISLCPATETIITWEDMRLAKFHRTPNGTQTKQGDESPKSWQNRIVEMNLAKEEGTDHRPKSCLLLWHCCSFPFWLSLWCNGLNEQCFLLLSDVLYLRIAGAHAVLWIRSLLLLLFSSSGSKLFSD